MGGEFTSFSSHWWTEVWIIDTSFFFSAVWWCVISSTHVHVHAQHGDWIIFGERARLLFVEMESQLLGVAHSLAISAESDVILFPILSAKNKKKREMSWRARKEIVMFEQCWISARESALERWKWIYLFLAQPPKTTKSMQGVAATTVRLRLSTKKYIMAFLLTSTHKVRSLPLSAACHAESHRRSSHWKCRLWSLEIEIKSKILSLKFYLLFYFFMCVARTRHELGTHKNLRTNYSFMIVLLT